MRRIWVKERSSQSRQLMAGQQPYSIRMGLWRRRALTSTGLLRILGRPILGVGDWGVRLLTVQDIADMLDWCSIMLGEDLGDAYHIHVFSGCTGELVWGWSVTGWRSSGLTTGGTCQRFTWGWRLHVACWPGDCVGTCEKACSTLCPDGFFMQRAVAHFGQKLAGSTLNVLDMAFLRYLSRRGMGQGSTPRPIQGGVRVDDSLPNVAVPRHPVCLGLEGQCKVCLQALPGAEGVHCYVIGLGDQLVMGFQAPKRQRCTQWAEYPGFRLPVQLRHGARPAERARCKAG